MSVALGLMDRKFNIVAGVPNGVEHLSRFYYVQGYAAHLVFNLKHTYNDEPIQGPGVAKPGDTWDYELYGDLAYIRATWSEANGRHCAWVVCTKEYYQEGRDIAAKWVQQDAGVHEITTNPNCKHASNYTIRGFVTWKP